MRATSERPKGVASALWGKYDPNPVPAGYKLPAHVRFSPAQGPIERDPMCDYIEDAEWWIARSDRAPRMLQKAFDQQEVACLLYEKTGAIVELGRHGAQWLIAIQLVRNERDNWALDLSLSDAGIYVDELYVEEP